MTTRGARSKSGERVNSVATIVYVCLSGLFAVSLVVLGVLEAGAPDDYVAVAVLAGMGVASWLLRETDVGARVQFSFISVILLAAAVIVGPVGAAIVGALATVVQFNREPTIVRIFNVLLFSSMGSLGGLFYLWVGGTPDLEATVSPTGILVGVGLPLIVADVAQCVLNGVMLGGVLRLAQGTPFWTQVRKLLGTTGMAYIGYGVIGFLFVVVWIPARVGWFSAVLVLAPLFVARWAFVQYGDEVRAHDRTLRALVTAVEVKEPHNVGHSDRVAQLSEWMAEALGLGHKEIQDIRTAGMLHDVGKVSLPRRLLSSRTELSDHELVHLADHALGGVAIVETIDFLSGSVEGIAHHHERWDGLGYPKGLAGETIPLSARIVAVADVFDALTTARPYRGAHTVDEAFAIVTERSESQFDPQVVLSLGRALARHPWSSTERTDDLLSSAGVGIDHDEPEMSDLFAHRDDLRFRIRGARVGQVDRAGVGGAGSDGTGSDGTGSDGTGGAAVQRPVAGVG